MKNIKELQEIHAKLITLHTFCNKTLERRPHITELNTIVNSVKTLSNTLKEMLETEYDTQESGKSYRVKYYALKAKHNKQEAEEESANAKYLSLLKKTDKIIAQKEEAIKEYKNLMHEHNKAKHHIALLEQQLKGIDKRYDLALNKADARVKEYADIANKLQCICEQAIYVSGGCGFMLEGKYYSINKENADEIKKILRDKLKRVIRVREHNFNLIANNLADYKEGKNEQYI
jgi:uncharacterized protein YhaN